MARRLRIHDLTGILLLALAVLSPTIIHGRPTTPAPAMVAPIGTIVGVATGPRLQTAVQQAGGADARNAAATHARFRWTQLPSRPPSRSLRRPLPREP